MNLIEFIGFVISLAALIFLFFKKVRDEKFRLQHPEEYEEELHQKEEALKEILKSMQLDVEDEENLSPPPPRPQHVMKKKYIKPPKAPLTVLQTQKEKEANQYEERTLSDNRIFNKKTINAPAYEVKRLHHSNRGSDLIKSLPSKRDMLIYKEVFGKPLALRNPSDDVL